MKIKIKAFGIAREIAGKGEWDLEVADSTSLDDLRFDLMQHYPRLKTVVQFSLALNQTYVFENMILNDGDEIAIIPPVSGG